MTNPIAHETSTIHVAAMNRFAWADELGSQYISRIDRFMMATT